MPRRFGSFGPCSWQVPSPRVRGEGQGEGLSVRGPQARRTNRARSLRQTENDAEAVLWGELRGRRLNGFKFVRQLPIGRYFADFACRERMLVIEIDGSQHFMSAYDAERNSFMSLHGWAVALFWNAHVLRDCNAVLDTIVEICEGRLTEQMVNPDMIFLPAVIRNSHEPSA